MELAIKATLSDEIAATLRNELTGGQWVAKDGSIDLSILRRHLANGLSFVIGAFARYEISDMISAACVPHVILGGYTRDFPKAHAILKTDTLACYDELIGILKARHVKTILEFDFDRLMDRSFKNQFFDAGLNVRRVMHRFEGEGVSLGIIKELGGDRPRKALVNCAFAQSGIRPY